MARKQITDLIAELRSWLPNYDHGAKDYPTVLYRILASAPGGDELEDIGYEPIGSNLGWQELEQLGRVLETIQDKHDVEDLIRGLMSEEEEEVGEMREARVGEMRETSAGRTVYITSGQNLAHLIDNVYGHLTNSEATGLMRAIDNAEFKKEDPRHAAIKYLRQLGITVIDTPSTREVPRVGSGLRESAMGEAPRHVRKHRRDEQKHGSFVVVISDGTQQRFNEVRSAHDWAFERLQPLPNGSTALFYRAQVAPGRSDTGAPWTEPFDALEKNEYGRIVKGLIPQKSAGPFAHEVSENAGRSTESHELALYTVNDGDIYRQTIQPIIKNLAQKIHNGTYDADLAINAWLYAADAGAKKYTKEFGTHGPNGSFGVFTKADRVAAAREIGEQYDEEVQAKVKEISVSKNNARMTKPRRRGGRH